MWQKITGKQTFCMKTFERVQSYSNSSIEAVDKTLHHGQLRMRNGETIDVMKQ